MLNETFSEENEFMTQCGKKKRDKEEERKVANERERGSVEYALH